MKTEINQVNSNVSINQINENLKQLYSYQSPHLEIKMTQNTEELRKAKKLRQNYYKNLNQKLFLDQNKEFDKINQKKRMEQQQAVVFDGYDSFAEHLVVIDHKTDKVIAYVRLIDASTAYKIGGYYSEVHFNLVNLFNNHFSVFFLEMSRIVIDPDYNNQEIAQLLWSGLMKYSQTKGIDSLIGSFTLSLEKKKASLSYIQYLKEKHISSNQYRVTPYQLLPDKKRANKDKLNNPLIEHFFDNGSQICGDAHWNSDFNCAEVFFHYPLKPEPLLFDYIDEDEFDSGVNYVS